MSKEKRRVPKLRFPGFTEDWEQRKLGSIGSTYTGLSGKTKEDFGHGEAQYITYLNVFQNTISNITMTDKVEIDTTQTEVKYGDVLFTTSSETPEEVGMSSVWLGDTPNTYLNSFCFGFRPKQKIDLYFLGYSPGNLLTQSLFQFFNHPKFFCQNISPSLALIIVVSYQVKCIS